MSNIYVIFDEESNMFFKNEVKQVKNLIEGKIYKKLKYAIEFASLKNVTRNVPECYLNHKHYQERPQVVVLEIDSKMNIIEKHIATPSYIDVIL